MDDDEIKVMSESEVAAKMRCRDNFGVIVQRTKPMRRAQKSFRSGQQAAEIEKLFLMRVIHFVGACRDFKGYDRSGMLNGAILKD
jgi:hypothetical protein